MKKQNKTLIACFIAYIVQAIVNNFIPLLFITFHNDLKIPLYKITLLITFNFCIQLFVDFVSISFVDKIGYKLSILIAHLSAGIGLISLTILPDLFKDSFVGLLLSVSIYAIGGGLIEVLISPIVEACPSENKEKAMSLLHSFYCFGHVLVVLLSTIFFAIFGIKNWKIMAIIWALIPFINFFIFINAPIFKILDENEEALSIRELFKKNIFILLLIMMLCSGASEQAISQWSSAFAQIGLNINKSLGDLLGPMSFALLMGISRAFYGKYGEKINLDKFMKASIILCIISYIIIITSKNVILSLLACAISGLSVGIMWPGTFSKASKLLKNGGTAMFAFLALAGDVGCSFGPSVVGFVSSRFSDNLRIGILVAIIFPIILLYGIYKTRKYQ